MWKRLLITLGAAVLLGLLTGQYLAASPVQSGSTVFGEKCASCHTIGGGDAVGPDLEGVTDRRDRTFLERFISAPDDVLASGDPVAQALLEQYKVPMPNLGLTAAEVDALITYLASQAAGAPATAPKPPSGLPGGDPARGKNLFTGAARFENEGPPCLSCHTIAGIGRLGGGTLGPDLTRSYTKYGGDAGIASLLETLPFPTMTPLFADKQLAAEEQADLAAFLREAATAKRDSTAVWELLALGGAGVALLVALALLLWPRRALSVRKTLLRTRRGT